MSKLQALRKRIAGPKKARVKHRWDPEFQKGLKDQENRIPVTWDDVDPHNLLGIRRFNSAFPRRLVQTPLEPLERMRGMVIDRKDTLYEELFE